MKVLVLGATGMLGHKIIQALASAHDVTGTVRGDATLYSGHPVLGSFNLIGEVTADDIASVERAFDKVKPNVVINCIGMIKQQSGAQDPITAITLNALFPHQAARAAHTFGARFIHISTDCVFSGHKREPYTENDPSDAEDLYGRTKYLGEVSTGGALTLRTSIIGRELGSKYGLVEWFLSNKGGSVQGYSKALYTGLTTLALARTIGKIVDNHRDLSGLWHVSSEAISKFDLLKLINEKMNLGIEITENRIFECDRRLDSSKFRNATGIEVPSWSEMIGELAADKTPYGIL
jgi:dTDP-4-dehydrorhamnose reductase